MLIIKNEAVTRHPNSQQMISVVSSISLMVGCTR